MKRSVIIVHVSSLYLGGGVENANVYVCLASEGLPLRAAVVLILAQHPYKHVAVEAATSTVMYLLSNLCLSESPYILFRE